MFSTTSAIWLATSWKNSASASEYWFGVLLARFTAPMLRPRATRGTVQMDRMPSCAARRSEAYCASTRRSRRSNGR